MRRILTASIATLGCKLNQSESDDIARQLAAAGVTIVPFGGPADLCVVNSCTVTHVGDRKSRQVIRQAIKSAPGSLVAVAGCYAELEPEAVRAIDGVGAVLGNHEKARMVEALRSQNVEVGPDLTPDPFPTGEGEKDYTRAGEGMGERSMFGTRAFVKIQDGCDNRCSYCIVPDARGHQRSLPTGGIVEEIDRRVSEGYQEVVLTGVNITTYGRDHDSAGALENARGAGLLRLLEVILSRTSIPRVRLSSLQPEDWSAGFYPLWESGRLCRQLHLSLQSGSDSVLKRMRRRYNVDRYARIVGEARLALPGVAITTDVIAGFPGETGEEHEETERFLEGLGFAGLHVFKYSPRSGTAAAAMPGQVDPRVKQERSDRLIDMGRRMGEGFRSRFLGTVLSVLWEERMPAAEVRRLGLADAEPRSTWWTGLSDNYIRVYAATDRDLRGSICGARAGSVVPGGVVSTLVR